MNQMKPCLYKNDMINFIHQSELGFFKMKLGEEDLRKNGQN